MQTQEKRLLNNQTRSYPLKGGWVSFRLVDEFGEGKPYANLEYEVTDCEGAKQSGSLDAEGYAKLEGNYSGPLILTSAKNILVESLGTRRSVTARHILFR